MEAYSEPFSDRVVLVLDPEEARRLRDQLIVEMFAPTCIAREVADAIERQLLEVSL